MSYACACDGFEVGVDGVGLKTGAEAERALNKLKGVWKERDARVLVLRVRVKDVMFKFRCMSSLLSR